MNKAELIDAMASDAGVTKAQAKKALDSFTTNVGSALSSGGRVSLVGFGTFSVSKRSARDGRNPQTGKVIKINVSEGDKVNKGDILLIIEAMKMENLIIAPGDAIVTRINVSLNDRVEATTALVDLEKSE